MISLRNHCSVGSSSGFHAR